jgi:hypothetical protein
MNTRFIRLTLRSVVVLLLGLWWAGAAHAEPSSAAPTEGELVFPNVHVISGEGASFKAGTASGGQGWLARVPPPTDAPLPNWDALLARGSPSTTLPRPASAAVMEQLPSGARRVTGHDATSYLYGYRDAEGHMAVVCTPDPTAVEQLHNVMTPGGGNDR